MWRKSLEPILLFNQHLIVILGMIQLEDSPKVVCMDLVKAIQLYFLWVQSQYHQINQHKKIKKRCVT
ncbi:hypothetical protein Leryth_001393 [Lithospermum erythrorhizon]|nr:hypothetical protein Leryth_001393 [Lithospermum erythrorhizon]